MTVVPDWSHIKWIGDSIGTVHREEWTYRELIWTSEKFGMRFSLVTVPYGVARALAVGETRTVLLLTDEVSLYSLAVSSHFGTDFLHHELLRCVLDRRALVLTPEWSKRWRVGTPWLEQPHYDARIERLIAWVRWSLTAHQRVMLQHFVAKTIDNTVEVRAVLARTIERACFKESKAAALAHRLRDPETYARLVLGAEACGLSREEALWAAI